MKRVFAASIVITLAAIGTPASATSIAIARPHDAALAHCAIAGAVAYINRGEKAAPRQTPLFYTDKLGLVDFDERSAFLEAMRGSEGVVDRHPTEIGRAVLLDADKTAPLYLVELRRDQWIAEFRDMFSMEMVPAHFEIMPSYWLARFYSNDIDEFREVFALYPLMKDKPNIMADTGACEPIRVDELED